MRLLFCRFLLFSVTWLAVLSAQAAPASMHLLWTQLLQKHVYEDGMVDYKGFISEKAKLQAYLEELARETPHPEQWSKAQQKAYWLNAYNAFTVKLIIDHFPVKSINDLSQDGIRATDRKFIKLGRQEYSLNQIRQEMLLSRFVDARLHFALADATKSGPRLRNEAYTADKLDHQLDAQAKEFLNDPSRNRLSPERLQLSRLFEWHAQDFKKAGPLVTFLNKYSLTRIKPVAKVEYLEYDWSLNEAK